MAPDKHLPTIPEAAALFRLKDHVVIVTGAGGGIGRLASHILAQAGAAVVLTDRDQASIERVSAEIKERDYTNLNRIPQTRT